MTIPILIAWWSLAVLQSGQLRLGPHCAADLDSGSAACMVVLDGDGSEPPSHPSGKEYDLRLEPGGGTQRSLLSRNRAMMSKPSITAQGPGGCSSATYSARKVQIDNLPGGTFLCVRTSEKRFAELEIVNTGTKNGSAHLRYTTWDH